MKYDINQINDLIRNRRSIFPKMYTGELVPRQVIEQMLANANWAPTHKFTEPWRFKVFYNEGVKMFAQFQADLYRQRTSTQEFDEIKHQKLQQKPQNVGSLMAQYDHTRFLQRPQCGSFVSLLPWVL